MKTSKIKVPIDSIDEITEILEENELDVPIDRAEVDDNYQKRLLNVYFS